MEIYRIAEGSPFRCLMQSPDLCVIKPDIDAVLEAAASIWPDLDPEEVLKGFHPATDSELAEYGKTPLNAYGNKIYQRILNGVSQTLSYAAVDRVNHSRRTIQGAYAYVVSEAKKKAKHGCFCLEDKYVFGLAAHYLEALDDASLDRFEPDHPDTEPVNEPRPVQTVNGKPPAGFKPFITIVRTLPVHAEPDQLSFFDFAEAKGGAR